MRLQLSALALGALVGGASADVGGGGALRVYADDDDMTVVSPSVSAQVEAGETTIDAELLADVVSGASIDVITSASPRPVEEQRAELGIKATTAVHPRGAARVDAGLRASSERDHHAVRGSAGIRVEVLERRWTLDARYVAGLDEVGAVGEPGVWRERTLHQPSAGVTAVLDARTVAELAVEGAWTSGYQASPYRRVPLVDPAAPVPTWLEEVTPRRRRSIAIAGEVRRAFAEAWFGAVGYRRYADDWDLDSHTATLALRNVICSAALPAPTISSPLTTCRRRLRRSESRPRSTPGRARQPCTHSGWSDSIRTASTPCASPFIRCSDPLRVRSRSSTP